MVLVANNRLVQRNKEHHKNNMSMEEPKAKKARKAAAAKQKKKQEEEEDDDDDDDEEEEEEKPKVAAAAKGAAVAEKNDQGEAFFELSKMRRLTVREFKGQVLIDIREFYEKNDKMNPGKKGISLTLEQYKALKSLVGSGAIDKAIQNLSKDNGDDDDDE